MTDFLDQKQQEIDARLKELRPLVAEYERLQAAQQALEGVTNGSAPTRAPRTPTRRRNAAGAQSGRGGRSSSGAARGRPRGSGPRAKQALALVQENPGITIPELAERMGVKQNSLYRVLPGLESDGKVRKDGRGWYPTGSSEPVSAA